MGTIIGAKTCTWQQQRATKTTTTRLNLRTAQRLLLSPHFVFGTRTKLPFSHVVEKFIVCVLLLIVMQGEDRTTLNTSQQERL